MAAKFNNKCELVTNCNGCISDCMGTGYGYCVPDPPHCKLGGLCRTIVM